MFPTFRNHQAEQLFRTLRRQYDELVIPRGDWDEHFPTGAIPRGLELPDHAIDSDWVVVERGYFVHHFAKRCRVRVERRRIAAGKCSYWLVVKLKHYGPAPKGDLMDKGRRAPGSFRLRK